MIVSMTGHRPEKIDDPAWVKSAITATLLYVGATHVIQGMAAGVDLWSARCAFDLDIPYTCARPWEGHMPRVADRKSYDGALRNAERVVATDPSHKYPGPWVYQKRNEWMVDNAEAVIAVWDGSAGGTANCVKYAQKVERPIFVINPSEKKVEGWLNGWQQTISV